jgi:hypothetical protein
MGDQVVVPLAIDRPDGRGQCLLRGVLLVQVGVVQNAEPGRHVLAGGGRRQGRHDGEGEQGTHRRLPEWVE